MKETITVPRSDHYRTAHAGQDTESANLFPGVNDHRSFRSCGVEHVQRAN